MFIETHSDNDVNLTFIKSTNVQVYPCGRRRSTLIDRDGDKETTTDDLYYFPFDPEARLNTEANNRKHSGLNGYTQTYLNDWDESKRLLSMALAGYLFNITLDEEYLTSQDPITNLPITSFDKFGKEIVEESDATKTKLYANILLEEVHLFSGFKEYYTSVLRNQSAGLPETSLDLLTTEAAIAAEEDLDIVKDFNNFYFSGLSFSADPLSGSETRDPVEKTINRGTETSPILVKQTVVSLCILEKDSNEKWQIHQPALLPKIEHGETDDSIVVTGAALFKSNLKVEDNLTVEDKATVKEAEITDKTTITGELVVQNNGPAKARLDNATVTGNLIVSNPTYAANPEDPAAVPAELAADRAGIRTLSAGTIEADDIQQKIGEGDNALYYDVPVIFLEPKTEGAKTFYQLQISRVNHKN